MILCINKGDIINDVIVVYGEGLTELFFNINATTGALTVGNASLFDFETRTALTATITATADGVSATALAGARHGGHALSQEET